MSLKQFPAHGAFSKHKDEAQKKANPKIAEPNPRTVATVFDVHDAWDVLEKRCVLCSLSEHLYFSSVCAYTFFMVL
jgi:hypothetical protein